MVSSCMEKKVPKKGLGDPTEYCPMAQKWVLPSTDCKKCRWGCGSGNPVCAMLIIAASLWSLHGDVEKLKNLLETWAIKVRK